MGWLFCLQSFSQHCNTGTYGMSGSQAWNIRQHSTCQETTSLWNGFRSEPTIMGFSGWMGAKSNYNTFKLFCLYNYHSIYIALKGVTYPFISGNSGKSWCLEFEMHREGQQARNSVRISVLQSWSRIPSSIILLLFHFTISKKEKLISTFNTCWEISSAKYLSLSFITYSFHPIE